MLFTECCSHSVNTIFKISSKVGFIKIEAIFFDKSFQVFVLLVDMLDGFIDPILTTVLSWETEPAYIGRIKRNGEVHEVHILSGPLLKVLHESVVVVSAGQIIGVMSIKLYRFKLTNYF